MNLDETLAEAIQKTVSAAESGADFLASELPDYIQQLLIWYGVESLLWFVVSIAYIAVYVRYCIPFVIRTFERDNDADVQDLLAGLCGFFGGAFAVGFTVDGIFTNLVWLQILIAPKVFLVEYAARLVQ